MKTAQSEDSEDSAPPSSANQIEENSIVENQQIDWQILKNRHQHTRRKKRLFFICLFIVISVIGVLAYDAISKHISNQSFLKSEVQQIKEEMSKGLSSNKNQSTVIAGSPSTALNKDMPTSLSQKLASAEKNEVLQIDQSEGFVIPKKLWIYNSSDLSYFGSLIFANNKHFAEKSGFEAIVVDRTNFQTYLSKQKADEVEKFIAFLQLKKDGRSEFIIRIYILLSLIEENGGIMTDGECIITENFDWIRRIGQNPYVNRGNRGVKPRLVGFYAYDYTIDKVKENIKPFPGMNEVDKYMNIFPTLEEYFIAADKNTSFIVQLIAKIKTLIRTPQEFQKNQSQYRMRSINGNDVFNHFFRIAVQIVLQDKQKQIDSSNKDPYRHFALDEYGLNLINCYYAPYKYKAFWGNSIKEMYIMLTQLTSEEHQDNFGPMSYLTRLTGLSKINYFLQQTKKEKLQPILNGSIFQKLFYPKLDVPFIQQNKEKPFINETNEPWSNLPKIIWVFYDKGISQARVSNQICVQNMRRMAKLSGFQVREVNTSNAHQYLDSQTIIKINYTITHAKLKTFAPSLSDLYRLALISKHGGIYLDSTYVLMESLDWLVNIGRYPSQHIFNRFGHLPKVVMLWYGQGASPFDWKIDEKHNTKSMWHLAYESNFIAAQKGNQLIIQWFDMLTRLYIRPYNQVAQIFKKECKISEYQWIYAAHHYLIVMDSIKCVIGNRQIALMKEGKSQFVSASDYYKIWSLNGNLGQQKIRIHSNYENLRSDDLRFAYRYSQEYTEGIVGKFRQLTKFYSLNAVEMAKFVSAHMDGNFTGEVHPDSIFMRYLWQDNFSLEYVNNQAKLKVRT